MEYRKEQDMTTLIIGGSGSGKSEYAEQCLDLSEGDKIYLATMIASDEESRERVRRHRMMRADRNFRTVECPMNLEETVSQIPKGAAILLEGIGTLCANLLFQPKEGASAEDEQRIKKIKNRILHQIHILAIQSSGFVIVSDEVNRAGCDYEGDTRLYQKLIGELNQELCARSDTVVEMVCGCPVIRKQITVEIEKNDEGMVRNNRSCIFHVFGSADAESQLE